MTTSTLKPPDHQHATYRVAIGDEKLVFLDVAVGTDKPSGFDLLAAAGRTPPKDFIILQILPDGMLEELRLDEHTDLKERGVERFIVVRSDRSFRLEINDRRQEWPASVINGTTLKRIAGSEPHTVDLFRKGADGAEIEVTDDATVDLSGEGVERFLTRPRERDVKIFVNNKPFSMTAGTHTGLEIKEAAIAAGINIKPDFLLSLELADRTAKVIGDNDPVKVHRDQHFTAVADDDNS